MFIRPAKPADVSHMRSLEREADTAAHWAEREYDALFAPETPKRLALVAGGANQTTGFLIARCDLEDWEIENLVVAPQHRREGIGSSLVREALHQALKARATS